MVTGEADTQPKVFSLRLRNWVAGHVPFLTRRNVLLENWQWLGLFAIILAGMAFSRALTGGLLIIVRKRFRLEAIALDKHLEKSIVRPILIALMAWVWFLGLYRFFDFNWFFCFYRFFCFYCFFWLNGFFRFYRFLDFNGFFKFYRFSRI